MVGAFAVLLLCQLAGEGLVHLTGVPVPGPVVGLLLLALGLGLRAHRRGHAGREALGDTPVGRAANGLLSHLSLLFVPAAAGIVQQGAALQRDGLAIAAALVGSTLLTLAVTAAVFSAVARLAARQADDRPEAGPKAQR